MRKFITPYDARWPQFFEAEANALRLSIGEALWALHHVGSTSVPDMVAKPIIDILVEVKGLAEIDKRTSEIESLGYQARGAHGIEGRRYFSRQAGADCVGFHVHAYAVGSVHIGRHLRFRDYLRTMPEVAQEYVALKLSLTDRSGALVADYQQRKAAFVERIERVSTIGA